MRDVYTEITQEFILSYFFKCIVLDFLCNSRFIYKDPWLNSDSILIFKSDFELNWLVWTCQVSHGEFTPSVVYLFRSKYIEFK